MPSKLDELLNDLAGSKLAASVFETLEDDAKREKLTRSLNVLVIGLLSRRAVRKGLVASGLSEEQAKFLARAIPSAAWLIGTNFTAGSLHAEDTHDDLYPRDEDSE